MGELGVWPLRPDKPRREVEVIVVEEDGGVRISVELGENGVGERPIHRHIALVPGVVQTRVDVG